MKALVPMRTLFEEDEMTTTKSEMIERLRGLRDQIVDVEEWVKMSGLTVDDARCCQQRGRQWFEVCGVCIENGEAAKRLGYLAAGIIDLHITTPGSERDPTGSTGLYEVFVKHATECANEAVFAALLDCWPLADDYFGTDDPAEQALVLHEPWDSRAVLTEPWDLVESIRATGPNITSDVADRD